LEWTTLEHGDDEAERYSRHDGDHPGLSTSKIKANRGWAEVLNLGAGHHLAKEPLQTQKLQVGKLLLMMLVKSQTRMLESPQLLLHLEQIGKAREGKNIMTVDS
jgi:hypothetical protein